MRVQTNTEIEISTLVTDGECIGEKESRLLGEILSASNIDIVDSGVTIEQLLDGNSSLLTYEEMEFVLREIPTTRFLSMNLKQELQSSKLIVVVLYSCPRIALQLVCQSKLIIYL